MPTMTTNVFKNLRDHYQIPDHILIRLPGKFEKCYLRKTTDVNMYDAMFTAGLRLPLMSLHRQLANFLVLSVTQIAPNAQRIFIRAEILWDHLSEGNRQLSLDEFFWCYRPQHIISSLGIYHFAARKKKFRLVSDMPDSNRNWKGKYFFVQEMDQVCHREEWVTMPHGFDNSQGIVKDSGFVPSTCLLFSLFICLKFFNVIHFSLFSTSVHPRISEEQEAFIHRVLKIPFDERRCRDLITLDSLHAYCGGLELTPTAHRLTHTPVDISYILFFFPLSLFASAYLTSISCPSQKSKQ